MYADINMDKNITHDVDASLCSYCFEFCIRDNVKSSIIQKYVSDVVIGDVILNRHTLTPSDNRVVAKTVRAK